MEADDLLYGPVKQLEEKEEEMNTLFISLR